MNWQRTLLISLGSVAGTLIWTTYNLFVPLLLQAGHPGFTSEFTGFALSAGVMGVIMTLDNITALVIVPVVGFSSDKVGRRYPYILASLPLIALAFAAIPLPVLTLQEPGIAANRGAFSVFIIAIGLMLLGMAIYRTPVRALLNDHTPSPLRSKANGVAEFASGIAAVTAAVGIASLFDVQPWLPFAVTAALFALATLIMAATVPEGPRLTQSLTPELHSPLGIVPREARFSLIMLLLAVFGFSFGYNGLETFYSSYAVAELGMTAGTAAQNFAAAIVGFLICAVPAGFIGERAGRKPTMLAGMALFAVLLGGSYLLPGFVVNAPVLAVGGLAWALIVVNGLPMVIDSAGHDHLIGTYTGLYFLGSQSASIAAPIVTGTVIDAFGRDYNQLFLVTAVAFLLALVCMLFVTRGEHHDIPAPERLFEPT